MATVIYQFQEKLKTEGITDLTLFTEQIPFDAKEPDLIVEEDTYVLQDTSPAVNYKEVMEDFAMRCYCLNQTWQCLWLNHHIGLVDTILG